VPLNWEKRCLSKKKNKREKERSPVIPLLGQSIVKKKAERARRDPENSASLKPRRRRALSKERPRKAAAQVRQARDLEVSVKTSEKEGRKERLKGRKSSREHTGGGGERKGRWRRVSASDRSPENQGDFMTKRRRRGVQRVDGRKILQNSRSSALH